MVSCLSWKRLGLLLIKCSLLPGSILSAHLSLSVPLPKSLCEAYLVPDDYEAPPHTFYHYAGLAAQLNRPFHLSVPRFRSTIEEIALNPLRQSNVITPPLFARLLPPSIRFIHTPIHFSEDPTSVRFLNPNYHLYFRYQTKMKDGRDYGANLLISSSNFRNALKGHGDLSPRKYLVENDVRGVFFWRHGGGTPTANAGTANELIDHLHKYGITVISVDDPWHGAGPRDKMEFKEILDFYHDQLAHELIHPDVPILFDGHSLGGMEALLAHRMAVNGAYPRFKGFISIAGVADPAPGLTARQKIEVAKLLQDQQDDRWERMSPDDRKFLKSILENGKIAPTTENFLALVNFVHDLTPPSPEELATMRPLLVISAVADGLTFVGMESHFDRYLQSLGPLVTDIRIGKRVNIHGQYGPIGHGVFAHHPSFLSEAEKASLSEEEIAKRELEEYKRAHDTKQRFSFETYDLMHKFMSDLVVSMGSDPILDVEEGKSTNPNYHREVGYFSEAIWWLTNYSHSLAFREFAKNAVVHVEEISQELKHADYEMGLLRAFKTNLEHISGKNRELVERRVEEIMEERGIRVRNQDLKLESALDIWTRRYPEGEKGAAVNWLPDTPPPFPTIDEFIALREKRAVQDKDSVPKKRGIYVPSGHPQSNRIKELIGQRADLEQQMNGLSKKIDTGIRQINEDKLAYANAKKHWSQLARSSFSLKSDLLMNKIEAVLEKYHEAYKLLGEAHTEWLLGLFEANAPRSAYLEPPEFVVRAESDFDHWGERFDDLLKRMQEVQIQHSLDGTAGLKKSAPGSLEDLKALAQRFLETRQRISSVSIEINGWISERESLRKQIHDNITEYSELVPNTLTSREIRVWDLFQADESVFVSESKALAKVRKLWSEIHSSIPPVDQKDITSIPIIEE